MDMAVGPQHILRCDPFHRLVGIPFVQLVEIDNLCDTVCKTDIPQRGNSFGLSGVLKHPVAQKQTEVLGVILSQLLLRIRQAKDGIGKVILAIVNNGVNVPEFGGGLHNIWGFRIIISTVRVSLVRV